MNDQVTRPRTRGKRPRHNYSPASNFDPSSRTRGSSMPCRRVREGLRRSLKPLGFSFSTRIPLVGVFLRRRRGEHMFHYPTRCSIRMTERRRGHSSVVTPIAWPKWRSRRSWTAQVEGGVRGRACNRCGVPNGTLTFVKPEIKGKRGLRRKSGLNQYPNQTPRDSPANVVIPIRYASAIAHPEF